MEEDKEMMVMKKMRMMIKYRMWKRREENAEMNHRYPWRGQDAEINKGG